MNTVTTIGSNKVSKSVSKRSLGKLLAPLDQLATTTSNLKSSPVGCFRIKGRSYILPRYVFSGPQGGGDTLRIGLFAGVHGDQPEGVYALIRLLTILTQRPEWATGYTLFFYPVCNPTGFEDNTRHSRNGHDLNTQFWNSSPDPEVLLVQREILAQFFHGIITLQTDPLGSGVYGLARGAALTRHLLKPALAAAGQLLPRNEQETIGGLPAHDGIVQEDSRGVLSAPPGAHPKPFEITLVSPRTPPETVKEGAVVLALQSIFDEYRQFIAYAANL